MANLTVQKEEEKKPRARKFGPREKSIPPIPAKLEFYIEKDFEFVAVGDKVVKRSVVTDNPVIPKPFMIPAAARRKTEKLRRFLDKNPIPEKYLN